MHEVEAILLNGALVGGGISFGRIVSGHRPALSLSNSPLDSHPWSICSFASLLSGFWFEGNPSSPFRRGFQSWVGYPLRFRPFPQVVARVRIDPYAIAREDPSNILLALDSGEHDLLPLLVNEIGKSRNSRRCTAAGYAGVVCLY